MAKRRRLACLLVVMLGTLATGWSLAQSPEDDDVLITPPLELAQSPKVTTLPDLTFPADGRKIPLHAPAKIDEAAIAVTPAVPAVPGATLPATASPSDECCLIGRQCCCTRSRGGLFRCRPRCWRGRPLLRRVVAFCCRRR